MVRAVLDIKFFSRFFFACVKCAVTGSSLALVSLTFLPFWGSTKLSHSMMRIEQLSSSFSNSVSIVETNAPSVSKNYIIRL